MNFKVDYEKVQEVGNSLKLKSEEINRIYIEMLELCKQIGENWQSEDSSVYLEHMILYIKEKIKENQLLEKAGTTLNNISSLYSGQDNKWANYLLKTDLLNKERNVK